MGGFGWADADLDPLAFMSERMNERAFNWYLKNYQVAFKLMPISMQIESGGDIGRRVCESPGFEDSEFYREILKSYGVRWLALAPVRLCDNITWGFTSLYRRAEDGPFSDAEQASLVHATQVFSGLDCPDNPLAKLPDGERHEISAASLLLRADGTMAARSQEAMQLLYMLLDAPMHSLD